METATFRLVAQCLNQLHHHLRHLIPRPLIFLSHLDRRAPSSVFGHCIQMFKSCVSGSSFYLLLFFSNKFSEFIFSPYAPYICSSNAFRQFQPFSFLTLLKPNIHTHIKVKVDYICKEYVQNNLRNPFSRITNFFYPTK